MAREGVNIYGYVYAESGVGEHTRLLVSAVKEAGIDYAVVPFTDTLSRQECSFDDVGAGEPVFDVNIVGVNADVFPEFVAHFGADVLVDRYTIGLWAWELEHFPAWMASSARLVDEVWANSSFSAQAIQQQVCRPVLPFPLPIKTPQPPPLTRGDLGLPEGFLFLFCFDFDSIFRRKNPEAVVQAFSRAFRPGEGPNLFIKSVNGDRQPERLARLTAAVGDRSDIHLVDSYWKAGEVEALMGLCDAYVSLHRSEGFGLTLAEAMALGRPVIATGYSGNLDFMSERNSYPIPYTQAEIGEGCEPYPETAVWAEPDVDAAAALMRRVWEHPEEARQRTAQAQQDIERLHSPRARSRFVRERLQIVFKELRERRASGMVPGQTAGAATVPGGGGDIADAVRQRLLQGPDAGMPSSFGRLAPLVRRVMLRLMQNYTVYQRGVDEAMVEAISALEQRLDSQTRTLSAAGEGRSAAIDPRVPKELLRVSEQLQILIARCEGWLAGAEDSGSVDTAGIAQLAEEMRGLLDRQQRALALLE